MMMQQARRPATTPLSFLKTTTTALTTTALWLLVCIGGVGLSDAWSLMPHTSFSSTRTTTKPSTFRLLSSRNKDEVTCAVRRLGLTGVSVSGGGFAVLWGLANAKGEKVFWPWYVTTPQAGDKKAVTSAQALTLCQLIAGIDLAGSRLPADLLAQVTVLSCEQDAGLSDRISTAADPNNNGGTAERLVQDIQRQVQSIQRQWFPKEAAKASKPLSYTDALGWIRARVRLPVCTLDQIIVEPNTDSDGRFQVSLHVQVRGYGRLVVEHVTDQVLSDALEPLYDDYTFSDETRRAFLTTALSLRYKAPVLLEHDGDATDPEEDKNLFVKDATQAFPLYTTVAKVQTPSDRVVSHIERSWEVHQLQAAYQIAIKKKDMKAVAKIRAKLDEMEEMSELPVQADSELDSMQ